jgi:hypothetical protein
MLISFITARLLLPVANEARDDSRETELVIVFLSVGMLETLGEFSRVLVFRYRFTKLVKS